MICRLSTLFFAASAALAAPALAAAPHHLYLPVNTAVGGQPTEAYLPQVFQAPTRLSGAALADAALKELRGKLAEAGSLDVAYRGTTADVTVADGKAADAAVVDRALGAVYHTLRSAGFTTVRVGDRTVDASAFTRGAFLPVAPVTAALEAKIDGGFVLVGDEAIPANRFATQLQGGDKQVQAAVVKLLGGSSTEVKLALLSRLDRFGFKDADTVVIDRLGDGDPRVRTAALDRLKGNAASPVLKALERVVETDKDPDVNLTAVRLLVAAGKTQYEKYLLVDKLKSPDGAVIVQALKGLVKTGDTKFAPSIAKLRTHSNPSVRREALASLTAMKQFGLIATWVDDAAAAADMRQAGARVLTDKATGTDQVTGIRYLLASGDEAQAVHAAQVTGKGSIAGTTKALGKALSRPEEGVRAAAGDALGAIKDTAGLEPLAEAVRKATDADEREAFTKHATGIIAVQPLDQVIAISKSTDMTIRELAIKSLARFSEGRPNSKAISVLRTALGSKEASIRQAAAYALARTDDPGVLKDLVALEDDKDPLVRAQVAHALGRADHPKAEAILTKYLKDRDSDVKVGALKGIRAKKLSETLADVLRLKTQRKVEVRREVLATVLALGTPGDKAVYDLWATAVTDEDAKLKRFAIDGLAQYRADPRASRAIGSVVSDDRAPKALKLHAMTAIGQMTEPEAFEHAARGLFVDDIEVKMAALDALEKIANEKSARPLQEFIMGESDASVKARASAVLDSLP